MNFDLTAPQHYVADEIDLSLPQKVTTFTVDAAANEILEYLERRVSAVLQKFPQNPVVMLSGGIDSILLATVVAAHNPNALAVTFAHTCSDNSRVEVDTARAVAKHIGLRHIVVDPNPHEALALLQEVSRLLDNCDPWEVLAGATLLACVRAAEAEGYDGAILSGAGADVIFLGGHDFSNDDVVSNWHQTVRANAEKNFTRHRQIPDFYERLLNDDCASRAERHIQVWQTHQAYNMAMSMHPSAVRGEDLQTDKLVMREAARQLGLTNDLVMNTKNPMQVSSGGVDMIIDVARALLGGKSGHSTYTNPKTESIDFIVARLTLEMLRSQS